MPEADSVLAAAWKQTLLLAVQAAAVEQGEAGAASTRSQVPSTAEEASGSKEMPQPGAGPQPHTGAATAASPASAAAQPAACVAASEGSAVAGQAEAQQAAGTHHPVTASVTWTKCVCTPYIRA